MEKRCYYDNLKRFFSLNKSLLFSIFLIFLLGLITGIFCTIKTNVFINLSYIQNPPLKLLLLKRLSVFGFVFCEIIIYFLFLLGGFLLSFNKFSKIIFVAIFIFLSYILGIDLSVMVVCFGLLKGLIYGVICFIFGEFLLFLLMIFCFKMAIFNREKCIYGTSILKGREGNMFLTFLLLICITLIFYGLALFILSKIFVF